MSQLGETYVMGNGMSLRSIPGYKLEWLRHPESPMR